MAVLAVRFPGYATRAIERFGYAGYALPGIVVALALVFFGTRVALPLYQTLAMLVFALTIHYLPLAVGPVGAALMQVPPRLEEAARGLGRTPLQVFRTITRPLVTSGVLAGAALVFLHALKELPATLLLAPIGFETLATDIFRQTTTGFFEAGRGPGADPAADRGAALVPSQREGCELLLSDNGNGFAPPCVGLRVRGLQKSFGSVRAVAGADLDVRSGGTCALLGPSGCGKTTTLRMIAGLEKPDGGEIVVGGRVVSGEGRFVAAEERRIGMVFQDYALFPHMDVAANVGYGLGRKPDQGRVREALELVGLGDSGKRLVHELSGGQQQRVALARALAPTPDLVLLDEPFSNLDASLRDRLRQEVSEILRKAGVTAVFVTHDQEEAMSIAEHVAVMRDGCVEQCGTPEEVYLRPASRWMATFLGDIEVLPGEAAAGRARCELGSLPIEMHLDGAVDVLVRPGGPGRRRQRAVERRARGGRLTALLRPRPAARAEARVRPGDPLAAARLSGLASRRSRAGVDRGAGRGPAAGRGRRRPAVRVRVRRGRRRR